MKGSNREERRRYMRFSPTSVGGKTLESMAHDYLAHVDLGDGEEFEPDIVGFIVQQSHAGCCLILHRKEKITDSIERGSECTIMVGNLPPLRAICRWRRDLDDELLKAGFQFVE